MDCKKDPIGGEYFGNDKVGAEEILIESTNHDDITLSCEAWDNFVKACISKWNEGKGKFNLYNYGQERLFLDNASGVKDVPGMLMLNKKSNDNEGSLSMYGVGVNSLVKHYLRNNGWGFLITRKSVRGGICPPQVFYLYISNMLMKYREITTFLPPQQDLLNKLIPDTGTSIYVNITEAPHYNLLSSEDIVEDLKEIIITKVSDIVDKNIPYEELLNEDKELYEYLLEGSKHEFYYNDELIQPNNYIDNDDELLLDCELYYGKSREGNIVFYIKGTEFKLTGRKSCREVILDKLPTTVNETYINEQKLLPIGNFKSYKATKADTENNYRIKYIVNGIRSIGGCEFNKINPLRKQTMGYLKAELNIISDKFLRDVSILGYEKTDSDPMNISPKNSHKTLNLALSKIVSHTDILKHFNIKIARKTSTSNYEHLRIDHEDEDISNQDTSTQSSQDKITLTSESIEQSNIVSDEELTSQHAIEGSISSNIVSDEDTTSNEDTASNTVNTCSSNCKQKKKGTNLQAGGGLYLYTHPSWVVMDNGVKKNLYRWGKCEQDSRCLPRLRNHAREHPIDRIIVVGLWSVDCDVIRRESEVSKKLQDKGMQYDAVSTTTSDFYKGPIEEIKNTINSTLPLNSELPDTEYPDIYKD